MKKIFSIALIVCLGLMAKAQSPMTDLMKENGKIYVVIAVMLTLLAGLVLYLIRLDRRITKLEKNK